MARVISSVFRLVACLGWLGCLGCLGTTPADSAPDSPGSASEGAVLRVTDGSGQPAPVSAIPRRPRIVLDLALPEAPLDAVRLLPGPPTEAMLEDAGASPLRKALTERALAVDWEFEPDGWAMLPRTPLQREATYTLLVAAWVVPPGRAGELPAPLPWAIELRASGAATDGAAVRHAWPADGTPAVPTNLERALVTLDGHLDGGGQPPLRLLDDAGNVLDAEVRDTDCARIDTGAAHCIVLIPRAPLAALSAYRLALADSARDARGAAIPDWSATFRTAAGPSTAPPQLAQAVCTADEAVDAGLCVFADDMGATLRLRTRDPSLLQLHSGDFVRALIAPRGEATFVLDGLPASRAIDVRIAMTSAAGQSSQWQGTVFTSAPLPPLSITEVRSDPRGAEPDQEYVELYNFGSEPQPLGGFSLSDAIDGNGSYVLDPIDIAPGTHVLIVGSAFDPEDPADTAIPPGVVVARVDGSIGQSGLSNRGEPVFLRDPVGRRVSAAPATPTGAGGCLVRVTDHPRSGDAEAFSVEEGSACTPGR